ncbi:BREX-2 system phosphatase PglZ [Brachybacterium tyrofermentans]|uniref:BREX-2 system phosphatase PglZ n=1 Tax=Brachybacterium tyrofermentans TaxID=47848 RepID=UPI003FCFBFCB
MTSTLAPAPPLRAAILAVVEKVYRRGGADRVIGLRASRGIDRAAGLTDQHGQPVTVTWCPSALACWEALISWDGRGWLVLLTDRTEEELGSGLLARFAQHRLQRPEPWDSVKLRFRATGVDRGLLRGSSGHRSEIAEALLRIEPTTGWPAVRAGVLNQDVVYGAVARHLLGITAEDFDGPAVLEATLTPELPGHLADLRRDGGDAITDATLDWLARKLGPAEAPARHILAGGATADLLPLGLALSHITASSPVAEREAMLAGARLEARLPAGFRGATAVGVTGPAAAQLRSLVAQSISAVRGMLGRSETRNVALAVLRRTEAILRAEQAPSLIAASDLLPGGLAARRRSLAAALGSDPDTVERIWREILTHPLTAERDGSDPEHVALRAAVRLDRWLGTRDVPTPDPGVGRLERAVDALRTHAHDGGWAESALGDLHQGSDDPENTAPLERLAGQVLARRRDLDRAFAQDLAPLAQGETLPEGDVHYLENVLAHTGVQLAHGASTGSGVRQSGVLVLLVDGMSAASATDLTRSILDANDSWREIVPINAPRRATAVALLPSLTTHSRTSFFAGSHQTGGQQQERQGLNELARQAGLPPALLFHKDDLVTHQSGTALSSHIAAAIADVPGTPLVGCVLNTIDDALDKSDPGGTRWSTADVLFLRPLLQEAARAGRTVLLTADHGHVVERNGHMERHDGTTSARSRTATGAPAGPDEVLVEGRRVLAGGSAILAVDEDLRYTPRRAGYHGGASLSELTVPVIALRPAPEDGTENGWESGLPEGWLFTSDQRPLWWSTRAAAPAPTGEPEAPASIPIEAGTLDLFPVEEPAVTTAPVTTEPGDSLGAAIIRSERYADQKRVLRRTPSDEAVAALVDELAGAPGTRLPLSRVSQLLATPIARTARTAGVVAQLLNVEGFEVLRLEEDTAILHVGLARQQFEVTA